MQAEFREDIRKQYLVITSSRSVADAKDYRLAMINENHIEGLASCKMEQMNGVWLLYYDITGKMRLDEYLNTYKADEAFFQEFFSGLANVLERIREFLLDRGGILLNLEYIFIDTQSKKPYFVFYPYNEDGFEKGCRDLSESLLQHIRKEDIEAVRMGYGFYKNCVAGKISVELLHEMAGEESFEFYSKRNVTKQKTSEGSIVSTEKSHLESETNTKETNEKAIYGFLLPNDENAEETGRKSLFGKLFRVKEKTAEYKACDRHKENTEANKGARAWLMPENDFSRGGVMLSDDSYIVGKRIAGAHISLNSDAISRIHAKLIWKGSGYCLVDLSSKNGTRVNGKKLIAGEKKALKDGDKIVFADMKCVYKKTS